MKVPLGRRSSQWASNESTCSLSDPVGGFEHRVGESSECETPETKSRVRKASIGETCCSTRQTLPSLPNPQPHPHSQQECGAPSFEESLRLGKSPVEVNVGGEIFVLGPDTISSSLFLYREVTCPNVRDEKERPFMDRDPSNFRLLLQYLREGELHFSTSAVISQEYQNALRRMRHLFRSYGVQQPPVCLNCNALFDIRRNGADSCLRGGCQDEEGGKPKQWCCEENRGTSLFLTGRAMPHQAAAVADIRWMSLGAPLGNLIYEQRPASRNTRLNSAREVLTGSPRAGGAKSEDSQEGSSVQDGVSLPAVVRDNNSSSSSSSSPRPVVLVMPPPTVEDEPRPPEASLQRKLSIPAADSSVLTVQCPFWEHRAKLTGASGGIMKDVVDRTGARRVTPAQSPRSSIGATGHPRPGGTRKARGCDADVNSKYKTRMCPMFRSGVCQRHSSDCKFAHGLEELRATQEFFKTQICSFWAAGFCRAGPNCRHAHGERELRTPPSSSDVHCPASSAMEWGCGGAAGVRSFGGVPMQQQQYRFCLSKGPKGQSKRIGVNKDPPRSSVGASGTAPFRVGTKATDAFSPDRETLLSKSSGSVVTPSSTNMTAAPTLGPSPLRPSTGNVLMQPLGAPSTPADLMMASNPPATNTSNIPTECLVPPQHAPLSVMPQPGSKPPECCVVYLHLVNPALVVGPRMLADPAAWTVAGQWPPPVIAPAAVDPGCKLSGPDTPSRHLVTPVAPASRT